MAGTAPPTYQELGPFSFRLKEVRYNMQYNPDWEEVDYTLHQWQELDPTRSCAACTLDAPITSVNRGYLQFLAAGQGQPMHPETSTIYALTPITLAVIFGGMLDFFRQAVPMVDPTLTGPALEAAAQQWALAQWADCSPLLALQPMLALPSAYLADFVKPPEVTQSPFPFAPELCASIPATVAPFGIVTDPSTFQLYGLKVDHEGAGAFLGAAIGQSNAT
jgi:hypothetical protein